MIPGSENYIESTLLSDLKLENIDFDWINKQKSIKHLKKAIKLIEEDGNVFIDLKNACEKRIIEIDPKQAPKKFNNEVQPQEKEIIDQDINKFIDEKQKIEQIKQEQQKNKDIWDQEGQVKKTDDIELSDDAKKQRSDNEKNKGNEALKSHDYKEALQYYSKSIEYDPFNAASYTNRSLVYLKLKEYENAIKDANRAIGIQNNYLKAYHRRGKANFALKNYSDAYADFKYIIEQDPQNQEVNGDLQECKKMLPKEQSTEQGFKRVQIVEEDEEDEQQENQQENKETEEYKKRKAAYDQKLEQIESKKAEANKQIQNGMYEVAVKQFLDCLKQIQDIGPFSQELQDKRQFIQKQANFYNNIGLCYKQLDDNKNVIDYCGRVIDLKENLERDVLIKAYLRRALSFEKLEKFNQAQADFYLVKELEPGNRQASEGLSRVSNLVTQPKKSDSQQAKENQQNKFQQQEPQQPQQQQKKINLQEIEEIKQQGNEVFKKNQFQEAKQKFYEGIDKMEKQYIQYFQNQEYSDAVKLYIQIITNTALCHVKLNENQEAIDLCNKALKYDQGNTKALYRRGLSYKALGDQIKYESNNDNDALQKQHDLYSNASKDLERVFKVDAENIKLKQDFEEVNKKAITLRLQLRDKQNEEQKKNQQQKKKKNNEDNENEDEKTQQQQSEKPEKKNVKVAANMTAQQLDDITKQAVQSQIDQLINSIDLPESSTVFEKNLTTFKKHPEKLFYYIKKIPPEQYVKLYSQKDIQTDYFMQIIKCLLTEEASQEVELCKQIVESFANTFKFYICTMCLSKSEKKEIKQLFERIKVEEKYYSTFNLN